MSPAATHWRGTEKRGLQGVRFDPLPGTRDESKRLLQLFESWHWSSQILYRSRSDQSGPAGGSLALHPAPGYARFL